MVHLPRGLADEPCWGEAKLIVAVVVVELVEARAHEGYS